MVTAICIVILGVQLGLFIYIRSSMGDLMRIQYKQMDVLDHFLDTMRLINSTNESTNKIIERQTDAIKVMSDGVKAIMEQEVRRNMTSAELIDDIIKKSMKHE